LTAAALFAIFEEMHRTHENRLPQGLNSQIVLNARTFAC
jgi:hypothetical protein